MTIQKWQIVTYNTVLKTTQLSNLNQVPVCCCMSFPLSLSFFLSLCVCICERLWRMNCYCRTEREQYTNREENNCKVKYYFISSVFLLSISVSMCLLWCVVVSNERRLILSSYVGVFFPCQRFVPSIFSLVSVSHFLFIRFPSLISFWLSFSFAMI